MALELPTGEQREFWWQWKTRKPSQVLLKVSFFFARSVVSAEVGQCWHTYLSSVFPQRGGMTWQASPGTSEALLAPQGGTGWTHETGKNSLF